MSFAGLGWTVTVALAVFASSVDAAPGPSFGPEARQGLAEAAGNPTLAPWQREFMLEVARDGHAAVTGNERAEFDPAIPTAQTLATDGSWVKEPPPGGRQFHTAIYDPLRDRMVVFGGYGGAYLSDVWALSLSGSPVWTQLAPAGAPPSPRQAQTSIYDPVRDRMVVFGGYGGTYLSDAWALSLSGSPAWTQLAPVGTPPTGRQFHTAIYDSARDRMVVFGGWDGTLYLNDTWALSLSGSTAWAQLTPVGSPPSGRPGASAIYDPVRDRMLLFGGYDTSKLLNDVWALSLGDSVTWTQLIPAGTPPSAREHPTTLYDSARDRMLVFGGRSGTYLNDAWSLSLAGSPTWAQISATATPPSARYGHCAIYDPVRGRMLVFGGWNGFGNINDVWALSLTGTPVWAQLTPGGQLPLGRQGHTAINDSARNRMVVFGGYGYGYFNDVWTLSPVGPTWAQMTPAGAPPSGRICPTAIYDTVRDRIVMFGGHSEGGYPNDVWSLSLSGTPTWTQLTPLGSPPSGRRAASAIYDPLRDRMLVFGGWSGSSLLNDTWELSLSGSPAWTQLAPTGTTPSPRQDHTAVYDAVRDRMVIFGGIDPSDLNDVWTLSLSGDPTWTALGPTGIPPSARNGSSAIYDPVRDRMVVFAGWDGSFYLNDLWALSLGNNPAWTRLTPEGRPPDTRYEPTAIYDPALDRMVVFGGVSAGGGFATYYNDVWDLQWGSSALGVPPTIADDAQWLLPAYPNPSRSGTSITIEFSLPSRSAATLRVFDVMGRVVRTLVNGSTPAGTHSVRWDGHDCSRGLAQPGLYFYELRAAGQRLARRVVVIR